MPLFTVIIPTYNRSKLLAEAMESLRLQPFTDYELIVVDDGSTDDTQAFLKRFGEGQPAGKFRVLIQSNAGQGAARNLAIAQASGEYCVFLDDDDLFFPWTLSMIAEVISQNGSPSVIVGKELRFKKIEDFHAAVRVPLKVTKWPDLYRYALSNHLGASGTIVARTAVLREVGGFLTRRMVGEDADLMMRLGVTPNMIQIEKPDMYGYRLHPENFTGSQDRWHDGACELIRRYRSGAFPGGPARAAEAEMLIAKDVALFSTICLYYGARFNCIRLYFKTLAWQIRARNYNYLFKTPGRLMLSLIGRWPGKKFIDAAGSPLLPK